MTVRRLRAGDGPSVNEAICESREALKVWMPWAVQQPTLEESESFVRRSGAKWWSREDLGMSIWRRGDGRYLGGTGLHRIDWDLRKFEIGYWMRVSEQGQGYVTETVLLLCELCFGTLDANRVHIRCAVENERSAAIPRRVGFTFEGVLRNDIVDPKGAVHDVYSFSMTPEDWRTRTRSKVPV